MRRLGPAPERRKGAEGDNSQMSLMDHLRELRGRIVKCVAAVVVFGVVCYVLYPQIFEFFTEPYCRSVEGTDADCQLYILDLLGGFLLRMKVAAYGGLILALPVVFWQLWRFVMPGLYKNERRYVVAFVLPSTLLFALGATLAYLTLPKMLVWLRDAAGPVDSIVAIQTADRYFWLSAMMMLGFGLGFEFPVVLVSLQLIGIVDNAALASWRRQAAVAIVCVVAVITPGGDPISLIALSIPMYLFYELSILIGWFVARRRRRSVETAAG